MKNKKKLKNVTITVGLIILGTCISYALVHPDKTKGILGKVWKKALKIRPTLAVNNNHIN